MTNQLNIYRYQNNFNHGFSMSFETVRKTPNPSAIHLLLGNYYKTSEHMEIVTIWKHVSFWNATLPSTDKA